MNRFPFPPYRSGIPHWTERVVTYCAKVLPIVFDNSLSYYEFLGHVQVKLNEVIKALNSQNLVFVEFTHMIELELQNFEKYMEERQDNFEQQMQEEWQQFKTEMETAWNDFKTAMEQAWQEYKDEMDQAWADFQTDMLQRFQTFQETITAQQTAFERRMEAVQQQFEDDMENRADTFEGTITAQQNAFEQNVETELEEWKDVAIRAILDTIRLELPDLISDVIGSDFLAPIIQRQGYVKFVSAKNLHTQGNYDLTNETFSLFEGSTLVGDGLTLADLASIEIKPNTSIVFESMTLCDKINAIQAAYRQSDFAASGYTVSVGVYENEGSLPAGMAFEENQYIECGHLAMEQGATPGFFSASVGRSVWQDVFQTVHYPTIRFLADSGTASFTCDYSNDISMSLPYTADLTLENQIDGLKYEIKQPSAATVDQTYDPTSANAQSGVAVAQAVAAVPTVTVDQTYSASSQNAQSGVAVAQALQTLPGITVTLLANGVESTSGQLSNFPSQTELSQYPLVLLYLFDTSYTTALSDAIVVPGNLLRRGDKRYSFLLSHISATFTLIQFNLSNTSASITINNQGGNVTWQLFGIK